MRIELSDYFKEQGFRSAYLFENNFGRKCVEIKHSKKNENGKPIKRFITYAKYLWMSKNKQEVPKGYEIDHINGDGKDDRIENLQILSKRDNILKEKRDNHKLGWAQVELECPICGTVFSKRLAYIIQKAKTQKGCCSRKCSATLHSLHLPFDRKTYIDECIEKSQKIDKKFLTKQY